MENILENKVRFMSAHMYCANIYIEFENSPQHNYGQRLTPTVLGHVEFGRQLFFGGTYPNVERAYLMLKPLSQISDEDAIEVAKIIEPYFAINNKGLGRDFKIKVNRDSKVIRVTKADFKVSIAHSYVHDDTVNIMTWQGVKETRLYPTTFLHAFDYLRSHGYALPFMGLSVEELINRGWVKLKEKGQQ